jgi:hypothetical protein
VDISGLDVHVTRGVVYLRGRIDSLRGYYEDMDLHVVLNIILRVLRQKMGIRDVICDVEIGGSSIRKQTSPRKKQT